MIGSLTTTKNSILTLLVKLTLFLSIFTSIDTKLSSSPTLYLNQVFILILLPVLLYKHRTFPKFLIYLFLLFFVIGAYFSITGDNTFGLLIKVMSGLVFSLLFYFYAVKHTGYKPEALFQSYMNGAIVTCCIFFFQLISLKIGFKPGYDNIYLGLRVASDPEISTLIPVALLSEPAHLAFVITPAAVISIHNILKGKRDFTSLLSSLLIITTILFATSSTGYIAILLSLIMIAANYRAILFLFVAIAFSVLSFVILYNVVPKFKVRFDDSVAVFVHGTVSSEYQLKSGSTMILYNHLMIATANFSEHPLTGTGLGSHPIAFKKYSRFSDSDIWWADMNKEDACSLFIRMLSETGTFGLLLLAYFLYHFAVTKRNSLDNVSWIMSQAILVYMFCALLRQGNYLSGGLPFYLILYFYIYKLNCREEVKRELNPTSHNIAAI